MGYPALNIGTRKRAPFRTCGCPRDFWWGVATEGHAFTHAGVGTSLLYLFFRRRRTVGGGVGVELGAGCEVGADGVLVDVEAAGFEVVGVEDQVVGEASLPYGEV